MTWQGKVGRALWGPVLALAATLFGCAEADAAYRLVFQNGTSLEVQSYEDLGEAIRYQRYGGSVVVSKAQVTMIQEVPSPATAPFPPAPRTPTAPSPRMNQGYPEPSRPAVNLPAASPSPIPRSAPTPSGPANPIGPFTMLSGALTIFGGLTVIMLLVLGVMLWFKYGLIGGTADKAEPLPYEKLPSVLSAAERSFYGVLCQASDHRYSIFPKLRLGDLVEVPRETPRAMGHKNRINQEHVDFVLCDPNALTPLLAIELDDSSHARIDRQERDAFVDAALDSADLPILHVSAQHAYAPAEVRTLIHGRLNADTRNVAYL